MSNLVSSLNENLRMKNLDTEELILLELCKVAQDVNNSGLVETIIILFSFMPPECNKKLSLGIRNFREERF